MLAESAGHYAELAEADPAAYEVARIDVLTRVALASDEAGSTRGRHQPAARGRSGCTSRRPRPTRTNATSDWPGRGST